MLRLPENGLRPYKNGHRTDLSIFCDWLEGSLLFTKRSSITLSDIKDVLVEEHLYKSQDKASEFLSDVWREFDRRKSALGQSYPIQVENLKLVRMMTWRQCTAYSFCLLLSFAERYRSWAKGFGKDFTEQGLLFEEITCSALQHEMDGWSVHPTGWSSSRATGLKAIVDEVRDVLGEDAGKLGKFPKFKVAKDAGLDVVLYRPYGDNRIGFPVYLVQCASGTRWEAKRNEPNIHVWRTFIDFAVLPKKALAIPFAVRDEDFWFSCRHMDGMLIDRLRLLAGGRRKAELLEGDVKRRAIAWMIPRVKVLPIHQ